MKRRVVLSAIAAASAGCLGRGGSGKDCPEIGLDGTTICEAGSKVYIEVSPETVQPSGRLTVRIVNESDRPFEYNDQNPFSIYERIDGDWVKVAPEYHRQAYSSERVTDSREFSVSLTELPWDERRQQRAGEYVFVLSGYLLGEGQNDGSRYHLLSGFASSG